ncbi:YchJ family protein [Pseudidiomarina piscicola]|uniref:YchJ family protein n=1 Tax=Pseudidiomarina piscicola TaxID=2614830 RepID=UPI00156DEFAC|nr:YchJ family metal-binding protein [Pseudidiomarina piscicola]
MPIKAPKKCPCGGGLYRKCCGRFHPQSAGEPMLPSSPELLMRSRYSAFVLELRDYLLATWHASTRPQQLDFSDNPQWVQLQIISSGQHGNQGTVHFRAFFQVDHDILVHDEHSEFRAEQGRWFYLRAKNLP